MADGIIFAQAGNICTSQEDELSCVAIAQEKRVVLLHWRFFLFFLGLVGKLEGNECWRLSTSLP